MDIKLYYVYGDPRDASEPIVPPWACESSTQVVGRSLLSLGRCTYPSHITRLAQPDISRSSCAADREDRAETQLSTGCRLADPRDRRQRSGFEKTLWIIEGS